jgi:prepilin-type N-terminal cleavage/methylation domain-containing protein
MRQGFTLIELLIVIGVLLVVFTVTMPIGSNWYNLNNFDSALGVTLSSLRKAQAYAIDKKDNATWGVCLTSNTIRLFSGSCASPNIKNDYQLPSDVTVTGLSTVTFSQLRGEPSSSQSIVITGSGKSKTIDINLLGGFDIN